MPTSDDRSLDLPKKRYPRRYYSEQAKALYELQMREAIMRFTREKVPDAEIAARLGQSVATIRRYRRMAISKSIERAQYVALYGVPALPPPPHQSPPRKSRSGKGLGPGLHVLMDPQEFRKAKQHKAYWPEGDKKALPSGNGERPRLESDPIFDADEAPGPPPGSYHSVAGTVLDPPDVLQLRRDCLHLRKAMRPFSEIAEILGVSEQEARQRTAEAISELETSERLNADLERRLMIEQIDQMIAAIHPMSTGKMLNNERTPIVLEAIDRTLKLMKQKADLLGLSAPPAVDIRIRLQALADEGGYDIVDLEDIAKDVLTAHKIRLPEFRG